LAEQVLAAVRTGAHKTEFREYPMPEVPDDGALMKVEVAGICGTDVKLYAKPQSNGGRTYCAPRELSISKATTAASSSRPFT